MARIVSIDYGTKRTGLAVTDPLQIIATALETVRSHELLAFLKKYTDQEAVEAFVVGMPRKLNNTDTNNTPFVKNFIKQLRKAFPDIPVYEHDERFTSSMALQTMIAMGSKKSERRDKTNLDKMSAAIILQSFLDSRSQKTN
ncbi:MAG: Holliday junction resolvase RuvX [Runella sp.]